MSRWRNLGWRGALHNASPEFINCPLKNFGTKSMQNLVRFYATSNFDRGYLRKNSRYPKSQRHVIEYDSSRVCERSPVNFGPLSRK